MLDDRELEQFSRQLILAGFELEHQERLREARVLVVGCGGLGSPLALYLAAAGVGSLVLADGDVVERSNLPRQVLYGEGDVGCGKAATAATLLAARYPGCSVHALAARLDGEQLRSAVSDATLVADGSDNYPTRYALNRACREHGRVLVSAAAVRGEGQLATFDPTQGTACYRCLYPQEGADSALSCRESGVLGPVVGTLGTLQALEVIKVISGWGENLAGRLLSLDLHSYRQQILALTRRANCPDCSG